MYWRMYFVHAVRRACILAGAAWLCALPAAGQAIPDEGYPSKPVFPEESSAPPALHEECGAFLLAHPVTPDAFPEECAGNAAGDGNNGLDGAGNGVAGAGSSSAALDPALHTPPRLECPSAVFLEEMETGAIDCHAYDAAGEEHLDYFWEPIGGATRDYLENPRLLPEDAPNPVVVAPSFPVYDTLESFLSEEGAQRYRYRLTATSRATGLSSHAEVEVFVHSSQPGVYCPLELEVEEGATVVLACEGADPLSFRMDASDERGGGSLALWAWEGLWGSSTSPLAATDTPQPLFTAPAGSAGNTYHYVASLTTSSSGVPRTARRRVSVTVKAGEGVAVPHITCPGIPHEGHSVSHAVYKNSYDVYEGSGELTLECEAENAPEGATYVWSSNIARPTWLPASVPSFDDLIKDPDKLVTTFQVPDEMQDYRPPGFSGRIDARNFRYKVEMFGDGDGPVASAELIVAVWETSNIKIQCPDYELYPTARNFNIDCKVSPKVPPGATYSWESLDGNDDPNGEDPLLYRTSNMPQNRRRFNTFDHLDYTSTIEKELEFKYRVTMSAPGIDDVTDDFTVTFLKMPDLMDCEKNEYTVYAGQKEDIQLDCKPNYPDREMPEWIWEIGPKSNEKIAKDMRLDSPWNLEGEFRSASEFDPTFRVPKTLPTGKKIDVYQYFLCMWQEAPSGYEGIDDYQIAESEYITVTVRERLDAMVTCADESVYEGAAPIPLDCSVTTTLDASSLTYAWEAVGSPADTNPLADASGPTPTFNVPAQVAMDEMHTYRLTVSMGGIEATPAEVTVTVRDKPQITVDCTGATYEAYERSGEISLNCEGTGAPGNNPSYSYAWTSRGDPEDIHLLRAPNTGDPTFQVPYNVEGTTQYEYTVTATAADADMGTRDVTVTVLERPDIDVTCRGNPYSVYEGSEDLMLDCAASGVPGALGTPGAAPVYTYAWTPSRNTGDPADIDLLSDTAIPNPMFDVPADVTQSTKYDYLFRITAPNADPASAQVTVTVLNEGAISLACADPEVYEGSPDLTLHCTVSGGAGDNPEYTFAWTPAGSTPDVSLLSADNLQNPVFAVPNTVSQDETYEYRVTASSPNAEAGVDDVTVTVLNKPDIQVACTGNPYSAYEGTADIPLNCAASGAPAGSVYEYLWTAQGATSDTDLLSASAVASPTFRTPASVEADETYEYVLTVTAPHAEPGRADVTVTVLNNLPLALTCTDPDPVYEGSGDIPLLCEASGAPAGSEYDYVWAPRNATPDVSLLSAPDMNNPTFFVPADVSQTTRYEYRVTARAAHADAASADVTVTVLNTGAIAVVCRGNPYSAYEGSPDITLDCEASGDAGGPESPEVSAYTYAWEARGGTLNTDLLVAGADGPSPTFAVPVEVGADETYEYRLTVSAENAEAGTADVTVTVLNKAALALVCANPDPVYEGAPDIALECAASGGAGGSGALAGSEYEYVWTARNTTGAMASTDLLSAADIASPTFFVPEDVPQTTRYEYQVTVSAENADPATAEVTVTVLNKGALALVCAGNPYSAYEGSEDILLDCSASGASGVSEHSGYEYAWTPLNTTGATADMDLLSAADVASPTFAVPAEVDADETYEYLLTVSAENAEAATVKVTVTVLNKGALALACAGNPYSAYEGSEDILLDCSASGEPGAPGALERSDYEYTWTPLNNTGATADTDLLSALDIASPTFAVPAAVDADETYEYLLTVSAENAEAATVKVTVTVLNKGALALVCAGNPYSVYEGSEDITLDCAASGEPGASGALGASERSGYEYTWTPLNNTGATADTDLLSALDIAAPTFAVPAAVDADETYEYLLTVSAENAEAATVEVSVTVLNKAALALVCAGNPYSAYEGSEDIMLDCAASGAPEGSEYAYAWTGRGATADTDLLSALDIASPTFAVPDSVDADETYEYLLTVSADHADDATVEVTVTVLNRIAPPSPEPVAFSGDPPAPESVASSADPSALGVRVGVSSLRFGVQSSDVRVSLDPLSEQISTSVSGPHHAGRMMLSLDGAEALALSIELVTPVTLRRVGDEMADKPADDEWDKIVDRSADTATDAVTDKTAHEISESAANNATSRGAGIAASEIFGTSLDKKSDIQADTATDKTAREISGSTGDNTADRSENKLVEIAANETFRTIADKKRDRILDTAMDKTAREISDEAWDKVTGAPAVLSLSPSWSVAESCESLSSQAIGGLHTEVRLSESDCRLLLFGGELDLSGAIPGRYAGNMDFILRTDSGEEMHSIEVAVDVVPTQRVILAGAEGVRFAGPEEVPLSLTEGQNVRISPDVAYLTQEAPSGAFAFSNVSLIPQEISISARFGYAEATEDGRETLIEDPSSSPLGDLSALVDIYPRTLILMPGEEGVIRYGIREEALASLGAQNKEGLVLHGVRADTLASMEAPGEEELMRHGVRADTLASLMKSGYAAFFEVTSAPHQYVRTDQLPQAATVGRTAHVTMRIPGAYAPDERAPSLRAELISVSEGASPSATFLVETEGAPFFGEMVAYDGDGRELGRRQTLVYTRSRVRMSLTRTPEGETVFLRFISSGGSSAISSGRSSGRSSGPSRISEPVSILWDAPQRDSRIGRESGAAPDPGQTPDGAASASVPNSATSPASLESAALAEKP